MDFLLGGPMEIPGYTYFWGVVSSDLLHPRVSFEYPTLGGAQPV